MSSLAHGLLILQLSDLSLRDLEREVQNPRNEEYEDRRGKILKTLPYLNTAN